MTDKASEATEPRQETEPGVQMPPPAGRAQRLRAATTETHQRLDKRIMAAAPFASRAAFGRFLEVQHALRCTLAGVARAEFRRT